MKRFLKLFLSLFMMIATFGCTAFVQKPVVSLKRTTMIGLDTSGADLEFYLGITNPNPFDLTLLGYTYDLKVMTLPFTAGGLQESVTFKADTETDVRLPVRVRFSDLVELLKRRPDPDRVPYQLNARLQVKGPLGEMLIPLENSDTFAVPETYRPAYYLNRLKGMLNE